MLLAKPLSMLTTKEVIIIPDGLLFKLPFEALTMPQSKGFSFARLAYVQKEYLISYAYSCYTLLKEKNPVRLNNVTSVFGNSSLEGATNNISSYAEVQALSDFLVLRKYLGPEATKAAVFRSLQEDRQVHFALHGKASIVEGKSAIVLPGNDTLFAYEIYERPINADLVHLNACETMAGANNASEGVISLARAFIFSGVQSVVSNLWLVDDTNARTLAIDFYKQLSKGISPANALAQAKRKAIGEGDQFTAHPYYWAGTILIGQPNRQVDSRWNYWLVVLLSMIFIITGVMLKKRFTTNS
jgi:CHAT domain-containing protein